MKPIPVSAAERIAKEYGYDQVIIVARKVGEGGGEHCTTYGRSKAHCDVAARCGDFLKYKVMGWHREQTVEPKYCTISRRLVRKTAMACEYICDGCGKRAPALDDGRGGFMKPGADVERVCPACHSDYWKPVSA